MKTVKNIIHNALIQAINYEITILESCSHMLDDPMAKRSLHSALEFAKYYEKRFKRENPFKEELNLWKEKSDPKLARKKALNEEIEDTMENWSQISDD